MNDQIKSVIIGACIAVLGALAVYIPATVADQKEALGIYAVFAGAVASIVVNIIRKAIEYLTAKKKELDN